MRTKYVFLHPKKVGGLSLISVFGQLEGFDNVLIANLVSPDDVTSPVRASDHPAFRRTVNSTTGTVRSTSGRQRVRAMLQATRLGRSMVDRYRARQTEDLRTQIPPEQFTVIAGHFMPGQYAHLRENALWITMIRDPVARAVSHYKFLITNPGDAPDGYREGMSFPEFARLSQVSSYQTTFLHEMRLRDFDMVCATEQIASMALTLAMMHERETGILKQVEVPHLNISASIPVPGQEEVRELYERESPDWLLYQEAHNRGRRLEEAVLPDEANRETRVPVQSPIALS